MLHERLPIITIHTNQRTGKGLPTLSGRVGEGTRERFEGSHALQAARAEQKAEGTADVKSQRLDRMGLVTAHTAWGGRAGGREDVGGRTPGQATGSGEYHAKESDLCSVDRSPGKRGGWGSWGPISGRCSGRLCAGSVWRKLDQECARLGRGSAGSWRTGRVRAGWGGRGRNEAITQKAIVMLASR